jgi:hypothetical protein
MSNTFNEDATAEKALENLSHEIDDYFRLLADQKVNNPNS